ncbi:unnamed protein product, partial [Ectocarpus sp. 12 AP-2014]
MSYHFLLTEADFLSRREVTAKPISWLLCHAHFAAHSIPFNMMIQSIITRDRHRRAPGRCGKRTAGPACCTAATLWRYALDASHCPSVATHPHLPQLAPQHESQRRSSHGRMEAGDHSFCRH